jgi:hypothetical protein
MRIARTNFDRQESRRDRRYALPSLVVVIQDHEHVSDNWSLGGFVLTGKMAYKIGAMVGGKLHVDNTGGVPFTAEVVRKDEKSGTIGFQFRDLTAVAMTKLDRALARRLVSRRRP